MCFLINFRTTHEEPLIQFVILIALKKYFINVIRKQLEKLKNVPRL